MSEPVYRFVQLWSMDTEIGWHWVGRKELNAIIQVFNGWQIDGFDIEKGKRVKAIIRYGMQTFATVDGGSDWYEELLAMLGDVDKLIEENEDTDKTEPSDKFWPSERAM